MKKIRFGILGTANITHRFLRGAQEVEEVEVYGIASRSLPKAQAYCEDYPSLHAYASYTELFEDESIDAVYIATPNDTHYDYVMEALTHGLHVLCEKVMMLHEDQVKDAFAYAKQHHLLLMEAMKPCFLPTTLQAIQWMQQGCIGELQTMSASYCAQSIDYFMSGYRAHKELGGGALYDLGVYPLAFLNHIHKQTIKEVKADIEYLESGIDASSKLHLIYEDGVEGFVECSIQRAQENKAILVGSKGSISIVDFWKSEKAILVNEEGKQVFLEPHDKREFQYEIRAFAQDIQNQHLENEHMSEKASFVNAHIVDHVLWKKEL